MRISSDRGSSGPEKASGKVERWTRISCTDAFCRYIRLSSVASLCNGCSGCQFNFSVRHQASTIIHTLVPVRPIWLWRILRNNSVCFGGHGLGQRFENAVMVCQSDLEVDDSSHERFPWVSSREVEIRDPVSQLSVVIRAFAYLIDPVCSQPCAAYDLQERKPGCCLLQHKPDTSPRIRPHVGPLDRSKAMRRDRLTIPSTSIGTQSCSDAPQTTRPAVSQSPHRVHHHQATYTASSLPCRRAGRPCWDCSYTAR